VTGLACLRFPQSTPYGKALERGGKHRTPQTYLASLPWLGYYLLAVDLYKIITKVHSPPNHDLLFQPLQNPTPWVLGMRAPCKTRATESAQNAAQIRHTKNLPGSISMSVAALCETLDLSDRQQLCPSSRLL